MTTPAPAASPWPDPANPGVPSEPEKSQWHVAISVHGEPMPTPVCWDANRRDWLIGARQIFSVEQAARNWRYLGPVRTDAALATTARVHATAGAERMREAAGEVAARASRTREWRASEDDEHATRLRVCAERCARWPGDDCDRDGSCEECTMDVSVEHETAESKQRRRAAAALEQAIRALALPDAPALEAVIAEAAAQEREAIASWHDAQAADFTEKARYFRSCAGRSTHVCGAEGAEAASHDYEQLAGTHRAAAAAIRARAGETTDAGAAIGEGSGA